MAASVAAIDAAAQEAKLAAVESIVKKIPVWGELIAGLMNLVRGLAAHGTYPTDAQLLPWHALGARPAPIARLMELARRDPEIGSARAGFGLALRLFLRLPAVKEIICPRVGGVPGGNPGFPVCVGSRASQRTTAQDTWLGEVWTYDLTRGEYPRDAATLRMVMNRARTKSREFQFGVKKALAAIKAAGAERAA